MGSFSDVVKVVLGSVATVGDTVLCTQGAGLVVVAPDSEALTKEKMFVLQLLTEILGPQTAYIMVSIIKGTPIHFIPCCNLIIYQHLESTPRAPTLCAMGRAFRRLLHPTTMARCSTSSQSTICSSIEQEAAYPLDVLLALSHALGSEGPEVWRSKYLL